MIYLIGIIYNDFLLPHTIDEPEREYFSKQILYMSEEHLGSGQQSKAYTPFVIQPG